MSIRGLMNFLLVGLVAMSCDYSDGKQGQGSSFHRVTKHYPDHG